MPKDKIVSSSKKQHTLKSQDDPSAPQCPPNPDDYDPTVMGSYGSKMLWRGFVPIVGGYLQEKQAQAPETCEVENNTLTASMQQAVSGYAFNATDEARHLVTAMDHMVDNVAAVGSSVADLLVLPVQSRLLYLFAGTTALTLLAIALLLSL